MFNLYDFTLDKLTSLMNEYHQKPFRARQLFSWIYQKEVTDFDKMSDISKDFREILKNDFLLIKPKIIVDEISKDGTRKLLLEYSDGAKIETALMPYNYGDAICVSSQVGCNMGCSFCASGLLKKERNLTSGEMVAEVIVMNELLKKENRRISHVVVMGTGEPFDNYENVMDFIRIINSPFALAIGARHISVSTCGIPSKIRRYALEGLQTNLAISLHAPNDEIRHQIMKISHAYPLDELMDAVKYYEKTTNRRVTYEYIMIKDINDSIKCAEELVNLVKGSLGFVNLIPYNKIKEMPYERSDEKTIHAFYEYLLKHHVRPTVRKEFGKDINASCGQLRAKEMIKNEEKL